MPGASCRETLFIYEGILTVPQISADGDGHEMPQYRLKEQRLNDSEYLLMSDVNPNSFDARYFGLIAQAQIRHVVEPLFTWNVNQHLTFSSVNDYYERN